MKRKTTALALTAILCTALSGGIGTYVSAESISGHLTYEVRDNRTVAITDFDNGADEVVIPGTIEGLPVTEIAGDAFRDAVMLKSVTIPDSVTTIGDAAFYKCTGLETLTLPDSVTTIGQSAFEQCISLQRVELPEGLDRVENNLFSGCVSLLEIYLPDSVMTMGNGAFSECSSLVNVDLGKNLTNIPDHAFYNCTSLTNMVIPISVTEMEHTIWDHTFDNCSIQDVYYAGSPVQWGAVKNKPSIANVHYGASNPVLEGTTVSGDVDGDNAINALDASYILQFAAYQGNGGDKEFSVFVKICIEGGSL